MSGSGRNPLAVSPRPVASATANGTGSPVELGARSSARLVLDVTALSGTNATLNVAVETSRDLSVWRPVGAFAQATAVGTVGETFAGCDRYVRVSWTIGGTGSPSFTFAVTGDASQVYVTPAEFRALALHPSATEDASDEQIDRWSRAASDEADDYLGRRYTLPLTAWPDSLRRHVGALMALNKMSAQGYNFSEGRDIFKDRRDEAIEWLKMVATSGASGIEDSMSACTRRNRAGGDP
jgi:phage gp36-like protein